MIFMGCGRATPHTMRALRKASFHSYYTVANGVITQNYMNSSTPAKRGLG